MGLNQPETAAGNLSGMFRFPGCGLLIWIRVLIPKMISSPAVDYGVYVDNFSNGQVNIGAGDFTFFVKSGYLIENGKLTQPIKDINIIGNGPQALADITMAAGDYKTDNGTWMCGKGGQSVPVTMGLPTVLVKKLTVGGTSA